MKVFKIVGIAFICLLGAGFLFEYFGESPKHAFARLVIKPIPDSVQSLELGKHRTMDSVFVVLKFKIKWADLIVIKSSANFIPVNEKEEFKRWDEKSRSEVPIQKEEYLARWRRSIESETKLSVNFEGNWELYSVKEGHGPRYIFADPDKNEVVFMAEAH